MVTKLKEKYIEGIGRRKEAIARVRITPSKKTDFKINEKTLSNYFDKEELQKICQAPFNEIDLSQKFSTSVHISGGGIKSQAESIRLGISRALVEFDENLRKELKKLGYLKRDPRVKERRKFGLKKARKAAQWSKR